MVCPLCQSGSKFLTTIMTSNHKKYFDCKECKLVFLDKIHYLNEEDEKKRYQLHKNDINDVRYQQFVSDIVDYIKSNIQLPARGLDFGSGPNSVIYSLLQKANYTIYQYDPYFSPQKENLSLKYNFIVTCEVIEHLYNPHLELQKLKACLLEGSPLVIKTDLYHDTINFDSWYYRGDPTHIAFYRYETFEWIKNTYFFNKLSSVSKRTIALWN